MGALTCIAGKGGVGKTTTAFELCVKTAGWDPDTEPAPLFMGHELCRGGRVVFVTAEESNENLKRKLTRMGLSPEQHKRVEERLHVVSFLSPKFGPPRPLISFDQRTRSVARTPEWHWLASQVNASPDIVLVVIDPVGVFLGDVPVSVEFLKAALPTLSG